MRSRKCIPRLGPNVRAKQALRNQPGRRLPEGYRIADRALPARFGLERCGKSALERHYFRNTSEVLIRSETETTSCVTSLLSSVAVTTFT